jgi:hypothetical protein
MGDAKQLHLACGVAEDSARRHKRPSDPKDTRRSGAAEAIRGIHLLGIRSCTQVTADTTLQVRG